MKRKAAFYELAAAMILTFVLVVACSTGTEDDESLAPVLFQDSFDVFPDPVQLYENAKFYFGWLDHDGDMESPTIIVNLINDDGDSIILDAEKIDVEESDDGKTGSISFQVMIMDGYQGTYNIIVVDDKGNNSNRISQYVYVNTVPPPDDDCE